jgi:hypothetical protein
MGETAGDMGDDDWDADVLRRGEEGGEILVGGGVEAGGLGGQGGGLLLLVTGRLCFFVFRVFFVLSWRGKKPLLLL